MEAIKFIESKKKKQILSRFKSQENRVAKKKLTLSLFSKILINQKKSGKKKKDENNQLTEINRQKEFTWVRLVPVKNCSRTI